MKWRMIMNIEMDKYKAVAYIGVVILAGAIAKLMMSAPASSIPMA